MEQSDIDFLNEPGLFLRNVSVDNIIFGYHEKELKVLLQQPIPYHKWTVTGGYIRRTETIEEAASRIALERTGLSGLFLKQFRSFGSPERMKVNGLTASNFKKITCIKVKADSWIFDYFVSVVFYTLTEFSKVSPRKGTLDVACHWWPVSDLPQMMFDHKMMIDEALKALGLHIAHYPIGYELLEDKFTLPEIHSLYETILGKSLDERNFAKRLIATGIIIKLNEKKRIGGHRSPFLYMFDKKRYNEGLESGVELAF
jgi:8-oxo-dGTP diphosphatase